MVAPRLNLYSQFSIIPVGNFTRNTSIATATTITIPATATGIIIQADAADATYTFDSADGSATTATADVGFDLLDGEPPVRIDLYPGATLSVISATGEIKYQFFRVAGDELA